MSQTTRPDPSDAAHVRTLSHVAEGMLAAGLGVAILAMLVLLLWISSPHAHGAPSDALRVAAGLWLLAHGVELVRVDTLGGGSAPLALTPLLLTALPVLLLHRCVSTLQGVAWRVVVCVSGGYLLVAGLATWFSMSSPFQAVLLSAAVRLPLLTVGCVAFGVWAARGWPPPRRELLALPGWLPWRRLFSALRACVLAVAGLVLGGAVLATFSLALRWNAASEAANQLTGTWSGRVALLLLCLALAPNAALWGTAYVLGPGFAVGDGNAVGPFLDHTSPQLPNFPLLTAVPVEGGGEPLALAALAGLPLVAAVIAGLSTARCCVPVRGSTHGAESAWGTVGTVALVGLGGGLGMAVLASLAGGPIGTGVLADFGPRGWLVGVAATAWLCLGALPAALWARWWRLRQPQPMLAVVIGSHRVVDWLSESWPSLPRRSKAGKRARAGERTEGEGPDWHATASRHSRWAALKEASGGLMPDLGANTRPGEAPGTVTEQRGSDEATTADRDLVVSSTTREGAPSSSRHPAYPASKVSGSAVDDRQTEASGPRLDPDSPDVARPAGPPAAPPRPRPTADADTESAD